MTPAVTSFAGQAAIVTGAAAGIGEAVAAAFGSLGANVVVADVSADGERVAEELRRSGQDAVATRTDVTDAGDVRAMVETCVERFGRVDVLVNGAGGFERRVPTWEMPDEEWDQVVDLNLKSVFLCSKAVLPYMIEQRAGRIVNVASGAGRTVTHISGSHYAAANAGVLGFARHLAREVGEYGITVNSVTPGTTMTPRIRRLYDDAQLAQIASSIPLGRISDPDDQVGPIVFLASEAARYVTGVTLDVNGGRFVI